MVYAEFYYSLRQYKLKWEYCLAVWISILNVKRFQYRQIFMREILSTRQTKSGIPKMFFVLAYPQPLAGSKIHQRKNMAFFIQNAVKATETGYKSIPFFSNLALFHIFSF